jgi:trigger factor
MKVKIEESKACRKKLRIEVPAEEVKAEFGKMVDAYARQARVPGFRPGKAPKHLIRKRYGKDIQEEVRDRLVPQAYREALQQESINPVAILHVDEVALAEDKPMSFAVTVDVPPDFKLPKYAGVSLKGETAEVPESEVDDMLNHLLESRARHVEVEGRPVQQDDLVQVDYEAVCDGQPLESLAAQAKGIGSGQDFWVHAGEHAFLPGFDKGLLGLSVGDKAEVPVDFGEDFHVPELAGRKATYSVEVKALRAKELPALDEEFLKGLGVESEQELRTRLREDLEAGAQAREKNRLKSELLKHLMGKTKMDLPQSVVEEETRGAIYDLVRSKASEGATEEQIQGQKEEFFEAARLSAMEKIKARYLLGGIARAEKIEVKPEEIQARMQQMAARYGMDVQDFRDRMAKENMLEGFESQVQAEKTLDFLLEQAKVKR